MAQAPACCHDTAACCRLAAIESSFHCRSRQPPATHGVQPVVRLRCGQEAHAGGGCSTCLVDGADWRGMASTATMMPKDLSHWSPPCAPHLPTHQRGRWAAGARRLRWTRGGGGQLHAGLEGRSLISRRALGGRSRRALGGHRCGCSPRAARRPSTAAAIHQRRSRSICELQAQIIPAQKCR